MSKNLPPVPQRNPTQTSREKTQFDRLVDVLMTYIDQGRRIATENMIGDLLSARNYELFDSLAEVPYQTIGGGRLGLIPLRAGGFLEFNEINMSLTQSKYNLRIYNQGNQGDVLKIRNELKKTQMDRESILELADRWIWNRNYNTNADSHPEITEILRSNPDLVHELVRAGQSFVLENHQSMYVDLGNGAWLEISDSKTAFQVYNERDAHSMIQSAQAERDICEQRVTRVQGNTRNRARRTFEGK